MTEFKLTIEAPELANAITALADAIANRPLTAAAEKPATRTRTKKNAETPAAPAFTPEMIANAGANLLERGLMPQLMGLLQKFGVQAVTQLRQDQYPAFAAELRALGANI